MVHMINGFRLLTEKEIKFLEGKSSLELSRIESYKGVWFLKVKFVKKCSDQFQKSTAIISSCQGCETGDVTSN